MHGTLIGESTQGWLLLVQWLASPTINLTRPRAEYLLFIVVCFVYGIQLLLYAVQMLNAEGLLVNWRASLQFTGMNVVYVGSGGEPQS